VADAGLAGEVGATVADMVLGGLAGATVADVVLGGLAGATSGVFSFAITLFETFLEV